jgi:hypothetical protein
MNLLPIMKQAITTVLLFLISYTAFGQGLFEENSTFRSYTIGRAIFQERPAAENGWIRGGIGQNIRWNNSTKVWEASFSGSSYSDFALMNFGNNGTFNFYTKGGNGNPYELSNSELSKYLRLFISNTGHIGIGTRVPKSKLHVYGSSERLIFEASTTQVENSARIEFWELPATAKAEEAQFAMQYDGKSDMLRFKGKVGSTLDQDLMVIRRNGTVGIGTILSSNPHNYKLAVNGTIGAKEIKVETSSTTWADFVFEGNYQLPTLQEVEAHIQEKGHLKDIPSAQEVAENGINLGEMDAKLLQKIEELTLYIIEINKENEKLNNAILGLKKENEELKEQAALILQLMRRIDELESAMAK